MKYTLAGVLFLLSAVSVLLWVFPSYAHHAYYLATGESNCHHNVVSNGDIEYAIKWSELRIARYSPDTEYFKGVIRDLKHCKIRTTIYEPSGVHVDLVRDFAEAWRRS